mmetsp:Transcript_37546/g.85966  ORF Transcript_37546/g.85966 Transcript_37546/m.85966 type:complete len:194 (+) Transcript_37546:103-684(+)
MADPVVALLRIVEKLSTDKESAEEEMFQWYLSIGGQSGLVEIVREMKMEVLSRILDAMGIQLAPSARNREILYRSHLLGWFEAMNMRRKDVVDSSGPCHWCHKPSSITCSGCQKHQVHGVCLKRQVPVFPLHLDDRYCRGCSKQKFESRLAQELYSERSNGSLPSTWACISKKSDRVERNVADLEQFRSIFLH